jgi:hypothetical protein
VLALFFLGDAGLGRNHHDLLWSVEFGKERARKGDRPGPMHSALFTDSKFVLWSARWRTSRTCQEVAVDRSNHLPGLRKTTRVRRSIVLTIEIIHRR